MDSKTCILIGAPVDSGKRRQGCLMGPDAYRVAGLADTLTALGFNVEDRGNVAMGSIEPASSDNPEVFALGETIAWTKSLKTAAKDAMGLGFPIFMGGDHSLSLGTVSGVAAHAQEQGRPQFVLWLDAHSDYHSPLTTASGNLHGTPVGYVCGRDGFVGFPELEAPVPPSQVCMIGLRSVDGAEKAELSRHDFILHDMRAIDENGIAPLLRGFLQQVAEQNGLLHVSLDVDFLDPSIAPAVGTTVPGGATFREGHLVMEMLCDSGLVSSLDLVELNPILDERGKTATLMVDLVASLMGRRVFDRPTESFSGLKTGPGVH
ncbi:arginase [Neptunicoccus cionae]|uniref:Arginase n=1 Tax=Neptunicoccus cionae TaxID=2035344 RepID=A0A916QSE4_9RHOB|nr:arginase [Amylibacter cionae]GGA05807.1 arginase [Amylibacter cionae]